MAMHWLSRGASGRRGRSRGGGGCGGRGPLLLLLHLLHSVLLLLSQWPAASEAVHSRRPSSQTHGGGAAVLLPPPPSSTLLAAAASSPSSAGGGGSHRGQYLQRGPASHAHGSSEEGSSASFASSEADMAVDMPPPARPALSPQPTTAELEAEGLLPRVNSYIPSNCSTCRMRQEIRNLSLQNIKDEIITKLGMKTVPNITGRILPKIPPLHHLLDIYGMQGDDPLSGGGGGGGAGERMFIPGPVILDEEDDFHARTDRVIAFAQPHPRLRHASKGVEIQFFRFSDKTTRNKVMRAHLWIYAKSWGGGDGEGGTTGGGDVTVTVYRVREARGGGDSPQLSIIHSSKEREPLPGRGRWITIDIRRLVVEWFKYPRENLGLVAQVYDSNRHQLVVTDPEEDGGGYIPFVEVHTTDGRKHRTKRTIGLNCIENSRESRCCRYPLTVDFEEFGWDWIIAPKRYEANYCSGECPFVFLQKYPHTHIVQQANPGGTAGPCCAPRKMSSISMLYFDNEFNIIHSLLPGMVVDRCGCS